MGNKLFWMKCAPVRERGVRVRGGTETRKFGVTAIGTADACAAHQWKCLSCAAIRLEDARFAHVRYRMDKQKHNIMLHGFAIVHSLAVYCSHWELHRLAHNNPRQFLHDSKHQNMYLIDGLDWVLRVICSSLPFFVDVISGTYAGWCCAICKSR